MPNPKLNIVVVKFMFSNSVKEMFCESYLLNKIVTLFYTVWRGGIRISISRVLVVILLLCFPNISIKADFEGAWFAYENGNYNVAVREFLRCAEKGNDKCQLYLGDIYRYGHGTVVRKDKALEWYLRSVNQKNSVAAGRLYSLYLHNSVISEDKIKAYMWFKVAKVLGQNLSIEKEERIKSNMTTEEAAESQRLAAEWWMTHQ